MEVATRTVEVTTGSVGRFRGGQVEIYLHNSPHVYRGEVESADVDAKLHIKLVWLAMTPKVSSCSRMWIKDENPDHRVWEMDLGGSISFCLSDEKGRERLFVRWPFRGDLITFCLSGDRILDPSNVQGLKMPQQT